MGVEPFLLSSSLLGVLAQRLVRKLCPECKAPYEPDAAERGVFGKGPVERLYRAVGCGACNFSGYRGRTGIYELIEVDAEMRRLVHDRAPEHALRALALARGMTPLRRDGARWIAGGATSMAELVRVTREA
jgi:general secretion pathway protein E